VQLIDGYGDAGAALTREVSLMTFVGSTKVGKLVMAEASKHLTPVVLELGGKDPFVVLPGTNVGAIADTAARAGWGAGGQNCIGAERFFVHASLVDTFVSKLATIASAMRQGPPINAKGNTGVDVGALCLPGEAKRISGLIDDAKRHGATVVAGGAPVVPTGGEGGQFFPPTLVRLPAPSSSPSVASMRLLQEEVFGPLITVIPFDTEEELVGLVNGCPFALGSSVFGPSDRRCYDVGKRFDAGMLAINDFATCYMCQSLPMGGLKDSGFGKFAGIEGLRGLCVEKAVVEDILPFVRTQLPPPVRYPLADVALPFLKGLMKFFYGHSLRSKLEGVVALIRCFVTPSSMHPTGA
jgi:acyl-CoA reductase-like NAD-dependent aldehyde dehydrogenase